MNELVEIKNKVVGMNQATRELRNGKASLVYVAIDAEPHMITFLENLCEDYKVDIVYVDTMVELAQACGVDVPTSVVVVLRE